MSKINKPIDLNTIWGSNENSLIREISQEKWQQGLVNEPAYATSENYYRNKTSKAIGHFNQFGIPEWDRTTTYLQHGKCQHQGIIYICVANQSVNQEPSDTSEQWKRIDRYVDGYQTFADASLQHVKDLTTEEKSRLAGKIGSLANENGTIVTRSGSGGINCTNININLESNTFDPSKIVVSGDDKTAFLTSKANFINRISSSEANPNTIVKRNENSKIHCRTLNITSESAANYNFNRIPIADQVKDIHLTTKQNFKDQIGVTELLERVRILEEQARQSMSSKYDAFQEFFPIGTLHTRPIYNNQTITLTNGQTIAVRWMLIQRDRVLMTEEEGVAPSYQGDQWAVNGRTSEVRLRNNQVPWNGRTQTAGGDYVWAATAWNNNQANHTSTQGHSHTLNLHSYHCTWYRSTQ